MDKKYTDLRWVATDSIIKYRKEILEKASMEMDSPGLRRTKDLVNAYCDAVEKVIDILVPLYDTPYGGPIILAIASLSSGCGHLKALESKVSRLYRDNFYWV